MSLRSATWLVVALTLFAALEYPAWSQGFGRMGGHFGKMGVNGKTKGGGGTPCTSTGIFNLSNVCNDIYFIGGLK